MAIISWSPTGRINRRALVQDLEDDEVLYRENWMVQGSPKKLYNKKHPGSDRYNTTSVGSYACTWADRYYSENNRKNFFFSGGILYFIDEAGNATALISTFDINAIPCSSSMRVSSQDIMYFSEGISTGMYSHDGNISNNFTKEIAVTLNFVDTIVHLDRLWGFEEDSEDIYFSVNLDPTNFTDSSDAGLITVSPRGGSKNMKFALMNETLYILKNDSISVLEGRTPSEFSIREICTDIGLASRKSLSQCGPSLVGLMSDYEVWSFGGTRDGMVCLSYNVALGGDLSKDLNEIINKDRLSQVNSTFHNLIYRMSFVETGETVAKMEYCFNTINEKDWFTRGANIGCYLNYRKIPDKNELAIGRSDLGRMMFMYRGLNWDNQATTPTMSIRIQSGFKAIGDEPRNIRVRKYWADFGVLGAQSIPIKMWVDGRNADSDSTIDNLVTQGETKSITNFIRINSQQEITSTQKVRWNQGKCRSFSLEINEEIADRDVSFGKFYAEIIKKPLKRSQYVRL